VISAAAAVHHLLLGHGLAIQALRAALPATAQLAITVNPAVARPATSSVEDARAASKVDGLQNRIWLDPLFRGRYPDDVRAFTAEVSDWSYVRDGDMSIIATPIDILGVNYYNPVVVAHYDGVSPRSKADGHGNGGGDPWPGCGDGRGMGSSRDAPTVDDEHRAKGNGRQKAAEGRTNAHAEIDGQAVEGEGRSPLRR
jgi:beta-glucosidase